MQLMIQCTKESGTRPCAWCKAAVELGGPGLYIVGTAEPVCEDCGERADDRLAIMLRLWFKYELNFYEGPGEHEPRDPLLMVSPGASDGPPAARGGQTAGADSPPAALRRIVLMGNNAAGSEPCAVCGVRTDFYHGLNFFLSGTGALVCESCAEKHDKFLWWARNQVPNAEPAGVYDADGGPF